MQSLNSLNDQIASFMVTGPAPLKEEEEEVRTFCPPEKETLQKSMTLMRHLLVDAQVRGTLFSTTETCHCHLFTLRVKNTEHKPFFPVCLPVVEQKIPSISSLFSSPLFVTEPLFVVPIRKQKVTWHQGQVEKPDRGHRDRFILSGESWMKAPHQLRNITSFSAPVQDDRASVLLAGTKDSNQAQFS